MPKFPVDAPKRRVVKTLEILGFVIVREFESFNTEDHLQSGRNITG
jgi:hypothetical protein